MKVPLIIPATHQHIPAIVKRMRKADVEEMAALGRSPEASLLISLNTSRIAWTGFVDSEAVCMFGVCPSSILTPLKGRPWMLGTDLLDEHAVIFLRRCRPVVKSMLNIFPQLENYVATSNVKAIEWLRWLGFRLGTPAPYGGLGIEFIKFSMERTK